MRRLLAASMAKVAAAFMALPDAQELANNVASWDLCDVSEQNVEDAIRHRMTSFGVRCGDVAMCAAAMMRVVREFGALVREVA